MRKLSITLIMLGISTFVLAQEPEEKKSSVLYTVAYNMTEGNSSIPLIGFVNLSKDDHQSAQIGFINTSLGKFRGGQISFVNTAADKVAGGQVGFLNTTAGGIQGVQVGFLNTSTTKMKGGQVGFVNTVAGVSQGTQIGFVNTNVGTIKGGQIGFLNTAVKDIKGGQIGFVNTARKKMTGIQIGFINYADEIESGIPIGLLSIVRKGGYKAIEFSTSEIFPVNIAFKTGVRRFYTYVKGGFNPDADKQFGIGGGLGTNLRLSRSLYYNPEAESMSTLSTDWDDHFVSLINSLRVRVARNLEIAAGPAITWRRNAYSETRDGDLSWTYNYALDHQNDLIFGARVSASIVF